MKIYISGPMSGIENFNADAFHAAARRFRDAWNEVFNPAESFNGDTSLPYETYMKHDLSSMTTCEGVALLPGWEKSKGASHEVAVAVACGLQFFDATTMKSIPAPRVELTVSPGGESVAQEAERIVNGPRQASYSHPKIDYGRTGRMWGAILGIDDIDPHTCCLMMCALKISREKNKHKRDNLVDLVGYAICADMSL